MTKGDRLGHSWREGRLLYPGLASDFANMIRAALALYEATGQGAYLERALAWQRAFDAHYANPGNGGYFLTASDAEGLVVRPASTSDDATPNPNSIAAQNLVRLAALTGDTQWREQADRLFDGVLAGARRQSVPARRAAQRARPAAARRRDRRHRAGPRALRRGGAEAAVRQPDHAARAVGRRAAGEPSGAGQDRGRPAERGVRLRRGDLLAAGDRSGQDRRGGQRDAADGGAA